MHIVCPHCSSENNIGNTYNVACGACNKTFSGYAYKRFKKPLISATTALLIGASGTYNIDKAFIEDKRYLIGVEYELIDSCVNSSRNFMNSNQRENKTKVCICALKETMNNISLKQMRKSESEFLTHFRNNIPSCR